MSSPSRIIIAVVLLLVTVEQLAIDLYLPSFPSMARDLNTDATIIQLSLSVFLVAVAIFPLLFGPMSEVFGRRRILELGLGLFVFGALLGMFAPDVTTLLIGRFVQGTGSGAMIATNMAMVRDTFSGRQLLQATTLMSIAWSFVPIAAPAFGGWIEESYGWRGNFAVMALYGLLPLILCLTRLPETKRERMSALRWSDVWRGYRLVLGNLRFMTMISAAMLTFAATIAFNTAAPFIFQTKLGVSPITFGWIILGVSGTYLLGTFLNQVASERFSIDKLIIFGQVLYHLSGAAMVWAALALPMTIATAAVPASVMIFAMGFIYPNAITLAFEPITSHAGIASAINATIQMLGCALASALIAGLPESNMVPVAIFMWVTGIVMTAVHWLCSRITPAPSG